MLQAYWLYIEHVLNTYCIYVEHCIEHVSGQCSTCWIHIADILEMYWKLLFNMLNIYWIHVADMLKLTVQYVECILQYIIHMLHIRCICIAKVSRMQHQNVYECPRLRSCMILEENTFLNCVHKTINLPNSLSYTKLAKKRYLNVTSHLESSSHAIQFLLLSLEVGVGRADLARLRLLWNHFKPICFRKTKHND